MDKPVRVLVVEDDPSLRDVLREAYAHLGFAVEAAGNARDGREAIRSNGFDLVVIDVTLPGGDDGFALANDAAQRRAGVILISGNPGMFDRVESSEHAYLIKPFRLEELASLSVKLLEKSGVR